MKSITFNPKIYLLIICAGLLVACSNDENEDSEDYYFEPVVDEILNIQVDESQTKDFTLVPFESTNLSYEFDDGLHIIIEFQEDALKQLQDFDVNISPIVDIPDIPIGFEFHFGLRFQPEGIQSNESHRCMIQLVFCSVRGFSDSVIVFIELAISIRGLLVSIVVFGNKQISTRARSV